MNAPAAPAALALAGTLLAVLWLSWRKPTWVLLLALASLALRPQLLWGGPALGSEWGLHQSLLVYALAVNALHFGLRRTPNWPLLALLATFGLGLAFGNLHPKLTLPFMLMSLALLALPFAFTQVVLEPGSRRACALTIMLTPLLSVALGGLLQAAGLRIVFSYEQWVGDWYRLEGATGNAAAFAALAFTGFAVALHESTRPGRPYAGYFAALNFALVILSGTRMAIFASGVFLAAYVALSPQLRAHWRRRWGLLLLAVFTVALTFLAYWPTLEQRLFTGPAGELPLSQRDELWSFYYREALLSPAFGRGFGTGFVAAEDWIETILLAPHNEYLHLLVVGGAVGGALVLAGIILWYRQLLAPASPNDREFLLALAPALAAYAITDNVLFYATTLPAFAYLAVIMTRPSLAGLPWLTSPAAAESAGPDDFAHARPEQPFPSLPGEVAGRPG